MGYPTLSVCMIVKNEEENLPRALRSIKGLADEVIVVDTGSTDRTVEIAKSFGAKVYFFEWCDDFSAARNESLRHATKDYILWLDGDDEFEEGKEKELKDSIKKYFGSAFLLKLKLITWDRVQENLQLRVFPRRNDIFFEGKVHEQVGWSIQRLGLNFVALDDIVITHHGYKDPQDLIKKLERNKKISEKELEEDPLNLDTKYDYARSLMGLGDFQKGERLLKEIVANMHSNEAIMKSGLPKAIYNDLFTALLKNGNIHELEKYIMEYENLFDEDFISNFALGSFYLYKGEYDKANDCFSYAEKKGIGLSVMAIDVPLIQNKFHAKRAFCLSKLGRLNEAKRYAALVLRNYIDDLETRDLIADTFIVLKDLDGLTMLLNKSKIEDGRTFFIKGLRYLLKKEYNNAQDELTNAFKKGYINENSYLALIASFKESDFPTEVIELLKDSVSTSEENKKIFKDIMLYYIERNDVCNGEKMLNIFEGMEDLDTRAARIYINVLKQDWQGMLQSLMDMYRILFPDNPFSIEKILEIQRDLTEKKQEKALKLFQKSIKCFAEISTF